MKDQQDGQKSSNSRFSQEAPGNAEDSLRANNRKMLLGVSKVLLGVLGCFGLIFVSIIALFYWSSFNAAQNDKENRGENTSNYGIATAFLTDAQTVASELTPFQEWQVTTASAEMYMECLGYMKPEAACYFVQSQVPASAEVTSDTICAQVLQLATSLGASQDFVIGESEPAELSGSDPSRCVKSLDDPTQRQEGEWAKAYAIKGTNSSGIPWAILLTARDGNTASTEFSIDISTDFENYFTSFKVG